MGVGTVIHSRYPITNTLHSAVAAKIRATRNVVVVRVFIMAVHTWEAEMELGHVSHRFSALPAVSPLSNGVPLLLLLLSLEGVLLI